MTMSETEQGDPDLIVARVHGELGPANYRVDLKAGRHHVLVADERQAHGGGDAGPAPYEYLLSGLAACTAITLRMYAERKSWPLEQVRIELRFIRTGKAARIERELILEGPLSEDQRLRLADVAERTPVTLTLKSGVEIHTELQPAN